MARRFVVAVIAFVAIVLTARLGKKIYHHYSVQPHTLRAQQVIPLWPHSAPEPAQTPDAESDISKPDTMISGRHTALLTNVTQPSISVYVPWRWRSNGTAALVFPGGGYRFLAWNGEGIDTCEWLNSLGVTCLLVKYRVPQQGHFPEYPAPLEDAQQAMRVAKKHAAEWHINPDKIGVVGFSAGRTWPSYSAPIGTTSTLNLPRQLLT